MGFNYVYAHSTHSIIGIGECPEAENHFVSRCILRVQYESFHLEGAGMRSHLLIRMVMCLAGFLALSSFSDAQTQSYTQTFPCNGPDNPITESLSVSTVVTVGSPITGALSTANSLPRFTEELQSWLGETPRTAFEVCVDFTFTWTDSTGVHNDATCGLIWGRTFWPPTVGHSPI